MVLNTPSTVLLEYYKQTLFGGIFAGHRPGVQYFNWSLSIFFEILPVSQSPYHPVS